MEFYQETRDPNRYPVFCILYRSWHCLEQFVRSCLQETQTDYQIILLDNSGDSPDGDLRKTSDRLADKYDEDRSRFVCCSFGSNLMYTRSVNELFDSYIEPYIEVTPSYYVSNPDMWALRTNWLTVLTGIWDELAQVRPVAQVAGLQYHDSECNDLWFAGAVQHSLTEEFRDWLHTNRIPNGKRRSRVHLDYSYWRSLGGCSGSGLIQNSRVFEDLGKLDLQFVHYTSDAHMGWKTIRAGYETYVVDLPFYHPHGSSSK